MGYIPLSGCAASPFSRSAMHCGKGDGTLAAGRPLLGAPSLGRASVKGYILIATRVMNRTTR